MKANVAPTKPAHAPKLHIPSWVPPQVAQRARENYKDWRWLADYALTGPDRDDLEQIVEFQIPLIRDQRMRRVWYELSRRRREDGTFMHPATPSRYRAGIFMEPVAAPSIEAADADARQGEAMVQLFETALKCRFAREVPGIAMTHRQAEQKRDDFLAKSMALMDDATAGGFFEIVLFDGERNIMTEERSVRLRAAAAVYEEIAFETFAADMRTALERDSGDAEARWLARAIASKCQSLFGSAMYGVTATITSVALGREISQRTVRQWCTPPCG